MQAYLGVEIGNKLKVPWNISSHVSFIYGTVLHGNAFWTITGYSNVLKGDFASFIFN